MATRPRRSSATDRGRLVLSQVIPGRNSGQRTRGSGIVLLLAQSVESEPRQVNRFVTPDKRQGAKTPRIRRFHSARALNLGAIRFVLPRAAGVSHVIILFASWRLGG